MLSKHEEQAERREVLNNDMRLRNKQASTFHQFGSSEADTPKGRFTAHDTAAVVGATPLPRYEGAPNWAHDPAGMEPPLNFDVNAMEPTGEIAELKASISRPLGPSMQAKATPNPAAPHDAPPHAPPSSSALVGERVAGLGSFSSRRTYRRA